MRKRKGNRWVHANYGKSNLYFITTCTKHRHPYFGNVIDGKMELNQCGWIAREQWNWMINRFACAKSHAFVVMPDHIHGVIEICNPDIFSSPVQFETAPFKPLLSFPKPMNTQPKSLSQLVGAFKTMTSKKIHSKDNEFAWQRSFHDRIIRNATEYNRIKNYIRQNPEKWKFK